MDAKADPALMSTRRAHMQMLVAVLGHGFVFGLNHIMLNKIVQKAWEYNSSGHLCFIEALLQYRDAASISCVVMHSSKPVIQALKTSGTLRQLLRSGEMASCDSKTVEACEEACSLFEKAAVNLISVISTDDHVRGLLSGSKIGKHGLLPWHVEGYATNPSCLSMFYVARILSRKDSRGQSLLVNAIVDKQKEFIASPRVNTYILRLWWGVDANTLHVRRRTKVFVMFGCNSGVGCL